MKSKDQRSKMSSIGGKREKRGVCGEENMKQLQSELGKLQGSLVAAKRGEWDVLEPQCV